MGNNMIISISLSIYFDTMVQTQFIPLDEQVFSELFKQNRVLYGGIYNDIKIFTAKSPYIRGSGFFTRIAIPFFKRIIAPNLIEFGSNFLSDITSGESAKSSAKRRGVETLKKTAKKLLTGEGRKIKKKNSLYQIQDQKKTCKEKIL